MARKPRGPRDKVFLVAYGTDGNVIEQLELSYYDYYDGLSELIDSNEYRAQRNVRRITGEIYDSSGILQQSFENEYADTGAYAHGRAVHQDGTVIED